ncbi:hypothetical protein [Sphingobacterium nematocida]|uniref:hypothetical protein n=1 Tax=Sphingobacterium nematocida TaxID=1513896 RepID=UPI0015912317|nr:hypothetical protein [Sphingobacterium nematocida]
MSRADIDELLWNKLPDRMTDVQRKKKIENLIMELRRQNKIINKGTRKSSSWELLS